MPNSSGQRRSPSGRAFKYGAMPARARTFMFLRLDNGEEVFSEALRAPDGLCRCWLDASLPRGISHFL